MDDQVRVELAEADADVERLDLLSSMLRAELLQLDVDDVVPLPAGPAPAGARALDAVVVGGLLIKLADSAALRSVVDTVRRWLGRGGGSTARSVRLEIGGDVLEISGASATDQERLVSLFVQRHSAGEG